MLHSRHQFTWPWWRHQMDIFSALLDFRAGNSPVTGEFPAQRPETRSVDVFFDLRLNKRLSKQSRGLWFKTPSHPLLSLSRNQFTWLFFLNAWLFVCLFLFWWFYSSISIVVLWHTIIIMNCVLCSLIVIMFMNCVILYVRTYTDVITWIPFPWPFVRGILHS